MTQAINLIQQARTHRGCSPGEKMLADFILSCLNYKTKVNMKEVVQKFGSDGIKEILDLTWNWELESVVREYNPSILK